MTKTTAREKREEINVIDLDQRYGSLRLSSPEETRRLRSSVERLGMLSPVLVSTAVEAERLVLLDGFKRVRVVTELGASQVWATLVAMDARAAKVAMVAANAPHEGLCDLEEAWIVCSLCREHGLTQVEVGRALGRDKSWVCRRLMLAERLEAELQEQIRLGLLCATVARELVRLPRGNQEPVAEAIRAHGLTSRQANEVVTALLATDDPGARREVLADPLRYIGHEDATPSAVNDPRLGVGANDVRRSLLQIHGASERLWGSVQRHAAAGLVGDDARVLAPFVERALRASQRAVRLLEQLLADSGLEVAHEAKA